MALVVTQRLAQRVDEPITNAMREALNSRIQILKLLPGDFISSHASEVASSFSSISKLANCTDPEKEAVQLLRVIMAEFGIALYSFMSRG